MNMYRDAVYRYHTKGADAQLSQRWKGVDVAKISTDFSEFAKFFCSTTKKELKNYFAADQEGSPELLYNMISFCKAFHPPKSHALHGFCSVFSGSASHHSRLEPLLDGIQDAAHGLTDCRNTICHGDFYSLDEAAFDRLQESCKNVLQCIGDVTDIMMETGHAHSFQRIRDVIACQNREIFQDDYTQRPPRVCILNRRVELTSEERQHFNDMIRKFQEEIRVLKQRKFSILPVCMLQDIRKQIAEQHGKAGSQGVVYDVEIWGELLAAKVFHAGKDVNWKRELNSLTVLLHSNIVQIKYVIYDGADRKHKEDPVGYVMERMVHCMIIADTPVCSSRISSRC